MSVALVTGASGTGIGRHAARALRAAGFRVWAGARRPEALENLAREGFDAIRLDLTDPASLEEAVARIGRIDVLVNNAAYGLLGPVEELGMDAFREEMETNLFGLVRLTQLALPAMREVGAGRIVNVSSVGGRITTPLGGAYHASKFALEALSDALRLETRGFGIKVSVVQPGLVRTAFGDVAGASLVARPGSPYEGMVTVYARVVRGVYERGSGAATPERVARSILHAAIAVRPLTRYRVGLSPKLLIALRHLAPDELWDAAQARFLKG